MFNNSSRANDTESIKYSKLDPVYHTLLIAMAVLICVSNLLVITLFTTKASLRSSCNYFLFSLAISDLAVGLFGIPMYITCEVILSWGSCLSSYSINRFIAVSTVYHILWITLEKYYAIIFPLQHKFRFDHNRVMCIIFGIWLGSMFVTCVELTWIADHGDPKKQFSPDVEQKELIYNIVTFVTCFVLPISLMIFAYGSIFLRILRRHSSILRKHTTGRRASTAAHMSQKMKSALLFFILLSIFVLCWFWWFSVTIFYILSRYNIIDGTFLQYPRHVEKISTIFRYSTSFINPALYTFFKRDFNKALKQVMNGPRLTPTTHRSSTGLASRYPASQHTTSSK